MSVRKRTWTTRRGEVKEAWIVDYFDQDGDRHIETFARKKDADAYHGKVKVDVRTGRAHRAQQERHRRRGGGELDQAGRGRRQGAHHGRGSTASTSTCTSCRASAGSSWRT